MRRASCDRSPDAPLGEESSRPGGREALLLQGLARARAGSRVAGAPPEARALAQMGHAAAFGSMEASQRQRQAV
eukprot:7263933-Alexandrium_andersonii.AAC.1